jgi:hypothetical protein
MRRALGIGAAATALVVAGLLFYLQLAFRLERPADPESARELRNALALYGRVVLWKGLLPQLWIALGVGLWLERRFPALARSRGGRAGALAAAALGAGLLVLSTLLRSELGGLPRVVFRGPGNFAATLLQTSAAVTAALLLSRALLGRRLAPSPR